MSCHISVTGKIVDVGAVRRCLFPTDDLRGSDGWLQACQISVCPTGDAIAIVKDRRLVILVAKWDSTGITQYHVTYSGTVHESDNIRAVICLPVVNLTKNSHVVPDWTCILLGFESGFVRFYTEKAELLLEEQLHNESVSDLKCRSQHNPRPDIAPDLHPEEVYVLYQSAICVISGTQLFTILRLYRGELARVQAKGERLEPSQGDLAPRKWGFQDQAIVNDVAVVGVNLHGTFDHLLTASTCGGFETKYRSSAPYNNLVLAAGSRPFLGYHYALEGGPQPVFSDVAKAVATKLKSALPGWLTGGRSPIDKQMTVAMHPADAMGCRFGLCDVRRVATSVILSPDHRLAAVSDGLGRILLVDAFRGITLRMFKGYREAQCSFIQVPDERHHKHRHGNKVALFLVIYCSKKGTVEIYTAQAGQKICTFTAAKNSRLLYNNYGLMGFATTSKSRFVCPFGSVLVDGDGGIKEVTIPFHFALSEKNSKRARDIHLYKKLRQFLKVGVADDREVVENEVRSLCGELKTQEVKKQALELLLNNKTLGADILLEVAQLFNDLEIEEALKTLCGNAEALLNFFIACSSTKNTPPPNPPDREEALFTLPPKQLANLQNLLELAKNTLKAPHVGFHAPRELPPGDFIAAFDLGDPSTITLKPHLDDALIFRTAECIFRPFVHTGDCATIIFGASKIATKDLFVLLLHYWVHRPLDNINLTSEMSNLLVIITEVVATAPLDITCDYDTTSVFWTGVRAILAESNRPFPALLAAILCRIVEERSHRSNEEDDMEFFSQERVQWMLLIGKLEDVALLNIILENKAIASFARLPKLKHEKFDVSLKSILGKGRGSVSEFVARFLTGSGVDPENLVVNDALLKEVVAEDLLHDDDDDVVPDQEFMPDKIEEVRSEEVFKYLNLLKTQFPYSLEAGALLANMCWEYALAWQKDIHNLELLEGAIKCLGHIPSSHIREGLSNLVWNTHLKIVFESTSKLLNKVGKLPKERLCQQDTGLSDYQIVIFLSIATRFLDSYSDAVRQSYGKPKPQLQYEGLWEGGPPPLVELALLQNPINHDLLHLHYQLSLCLQMLTTFAIKHSKPINHLFESYMLTVFFADFQTKTQINWNYADIKVQNSRTQFLFKVISVSLESVTLNDGKIYVSDHVTWMGKCLDLARLWNLDLDAFRRCEIVWVYTNGVDGYGDELFSGVENRRELGVELLAVAGKRLGQFLATSPNLTENTVALTTVVTRYVEQLNGDWCAPSSLEGIENLANRSLACLEDSQAEYKIAEMLLEGCKNLRHIHKSN